MQIGNLLLMLWRGFIVDAKRFVEELNAPQMEIVDPKEKKLKRKNKY